jgi:hypothetical protein
MKSRRRAKKWKPVSELGDISPKATARLKSIGG